MPNTFATSYLGLEPFRTPFPPSGSHIYKNIPEKLDHAPPTLEPTTTPTTKTTPTNNHKPTKTLKTNKPSNLKTRTQRPFVHVAVVCWPTGRRRLFRDCARSHRPPRRGPSPDNWPPTTLNSRLHIDLFSGSLGLRALSQKRLNRCSIAAGWVAGGVESWKIRGVLLEKFRFCR